MVEAVMTADGASLAPVRTFETLPWRIFFDSCTAQTLREKGLVSGATRMRTCF